MSRVGRARREQRAAVRDRPARSDRRRAAALDRRLRFIIPAGAAVLLVAGLLVFGRQSAPPAPTTPGDFALVAYQGEGVLGGREATFAHVLGQGKPVVLNFFAGACPPCRAEMPGFETVYRSVQDRVIFVGLDVGPFLGLGTHADARQLLRELGITYPAAYAVDTRPVREYVQVMPTTVFFDARGREVGRQSGGLTADQLRARIQTLLGS